MNYHMSFKRKVVAKLAATDVTRKFRFNPTFVLLMTQQGHVVRIEFGTLNALVNPGLCWSPLNTYKNIIHLSTLAIVVAYQ